jgi:hypothetical protein
VTLASVLTLAGVVAAPAPAVAAPQAGASGGGDGARARDLFRKGYEEYTKAHLPQAYALLIESWILQKSFDVAGNLALVENQLTRYREAAEHATYALANFPTGGSDAQRKLIDGALAEARTHVSAITVRVSVDRATVSVDGRPAGESPLAAEIFVEPGPHVVSAAAPGYLPAQDDVRTDKGTTHLITLTLARSGAFTKLPPTPVVTDTSPRPITVAGFAAAGLGLGLGVAFAILSKIKATDATAEHQIVSGEGGKSDPTFCAGPSPSVDCTKLHGLLASQSAFANASLWSFVAGSAVGVGTVLYTLVVPRSSPVKAVAAHLIPFAGPGTGGLLLKGAF